MTDSFEDNLNPLDERERGDRSASPAGDLPAVEPPSAGFIMQLFLIPALIVLVVVGVTALFGKLAEDEQDWRALVAEIRHPNEHRRWRAANGLAQLLRVDEQLGPRGQQLARNPEIATTLVDMLQKQLHQRSQRETDVVQQAFLALTLGRLDSPAIVLPVLQQAIGPEHHRDVRKSAMQSIVVIAGRAAERGEIFDQPELVDDLVDLSSESDPLFRQMAAYALGLVPGPQAEARLIVLLEDANKNARVDAAIALTRRNSTAGLSVFKSVLADAATPLHADDVEGRTDEEKRQLVAAREFEDFYVLKNTLKAVATLAGDLDDSDRSELSALITPVAENHRHAELRILAQETLLSVSGSE